MSTPTTWAAGLALIAAASACSPARLYAGPPSAVPTLYVNGRGQQGDSEWPLEDQFPRADVAHTQMLDEPPAEAWRPLTDVHAATNNPALAVEELKKMGASHGADGVIRVAQGAGASKTSNSNESWGLANQHFGGALSTSSTTTESEFAAVGTAIHRAVPGAEPFLGIACTNYRRSYDTALGEKLLAYVTRASKPAAPSISPGDFILGVMDAREGDSTGNCVTLNAMIQKQKPGNLLWLGAWKPGPASEERIVTVPTSFIIGAVLQDSPQGVVVAAEPLAGLPALAAGVKKGDGITSVNGQPVRTMFETIGAIASSATENIVLGIVRDGAASAIPVKGKPVTHYAADDYPGRGVMVLLAAGAHGDPDQLAPGDWPTEFASAAAFIGALKANPTRKIKVRREGMGRMVMVQLGRIPDDWYRVGTAKYVRRAETPQTTAPPPTPPPTAEPSPSAPPPATPAGCSKDTDCKGERICEEGRCVTPKK